MRQISFKASDHVYEGLERQARFQGITVGILMERLAVQQSRKQLDVDDVRVIRMNAAGQSNAQIAAALKWTNVQVQRRMEKLHLTRNLFRDSDRDAIIETRKAAHG